MYKNLNAESLGISARHHELIELTLTYKFRGFDLNIQELVRQIEARGRDHSTRFLQSANVKIGSFELPVDLSGSDEDFQASLKRLEEIAELTESLGATRCIANLLPYCIYRPYHENFELHRERIGHVARILSPHHALLGLGFVAPISAREQGDSQFIATPAALLTLIQTVAETNVGLCLDSWHWHVAGGTVDQLKDFPVDKIVMVRLADVPADSNLETITEEQRMLPGTSGVVPNVEWLRWLGERDYGGPITPYCHPSQFTGGTRTQTVEQAAESLSTLLQTARGSDIDVDEEHAATAR
jgi:sugar phosphate isomerase/epimerase